MERTSENNTYIFVDGSYFIFHRYFALKKWWSLAKCNKNKETESKETESKEENTNELTNPINNEEFVNKFKSTFIQNLQKLKKNLKLPKSVEPIIIVGRDCKRDNIWRNEHYNEYKANRITNENPEPFFRLAYDEKLFTQGGVRQILKHPKLEADDCIALYIKNVLQVNGSNNFTCYIITSDKDYLQLVQPNIHIYNLSFKPLINPTSRNNNDVNCILFCKTVMGDVSDNIKPVFPKCGIKTALKYYNNRELFERKLMTSPIYMEKYNLNKLLIDFNYIPIALIRQFLQFIN
jgi:5'-3' exonuclease